MYATVPTALPGLVRPARAVTVAAGLVTAADRTDFGQPEIENLRVAAAGDEQIRRLDVAVDDPGGVRRLERVGDLDRERQQQIDLERAPGDAMLQRRPVEELHDEERAAVLLADIVDGADVGVIQRRRGARLAAESGQGLGIVGEVRRQELQRDEALQPRILGFVDDAHSAAAQLLGDAVVRDGLTDQRSRQLSEVSSRGASASARAATSIAGLSRKLPACSCAASSDRTSRSSASSSPQACRRNASRSPARTRPAPTAAGYRPVSIVQRPSPVPPASSR